MSYQVLARKWRPQNFTQLVGQDHVKAALTNALSQNRLHHAYLFTGTRGVGKTTIARIFAKSLNCEQGITATPCGVCSACVEIDKGNFVDLMEIDAASRTKVEDTRDLLDNVQYAPSRGRYKVYLIDEVHMLSKHSFNALLKTLEEPPPHVKFLLATTDPQKLPITVLSRCLQFSLKALSQSQIKQHLHYILQQEQLSAEDEALALLARAAKGSLRDSLSLTDQAIAQTNGHIALGPVREMLGYLEQSWAELLLQAVLNRDLAAMQQTLFQLMAQHSQFQSVLDDMLSLLHLAALSQFQLSAAELALTESAFVRALARAHSPESIQLYYQLLLSGKRDLTHAPDLRTGLEMGLLRAIAFVPGEVTSQQQSGRVAALSAAGLVSTQSSAVSHVASPNATLPNALSTTTSTAAATEVATAPAIDPLAASILARRGLVPDPAIAVAAPSAPLAPTASLAASSDVAAKKSERLTAPEPVTAVPARNRMPEPVSEPVPEPMPASVSMVVEIDRQKTQDLPPWSLQNETQLIPAQSNAAQPIATNPSEHQDVEVERSVAVFAPGQNFEQEHVADQEHEPDQEQESELDPVADSAHADWAWQQYQAQAEATQPIRHALLDSLSAAMPVATDFAEDVLPEMPSAEKLEQSFRFDGVIDETNFAVRSVSQVDAWAARIDQLAVGGLMRLFLLHASAEIDHATTPATLRLRVLQSQQHLDNEKNRQTLTHVLATSYGHPLQLQVEFFAQVDESPVAIQQRIDQARYQYVQQLMASDPIVMGLQRQFAAEIMPDSLVVN